MFDIHNYGTPAAQDSNTNRKVSFQETRDKFIENLKDTLDEHLSIINKEGQFLTDRKDDRSQVAFDKKLTAWKSLVTSIETLARMYNINK